MWWSLKKKLDAIETTTMNGQSKDARKSHDLGTILVIISTRTQNIPQRQPFKKKWSKKNETINNLRVLEKNRVRWPPAHSADCPLRGASRKPVRTKPYASLLLSSLLRPNVISLHPAPLSLRSAPTSARQKLGGGGVENAVFPQQQCRLPLPLGSWFLKLLFFFSFFAFRSLSVGCGCQTATKGLLCHHRDRHRGTVRSSSLARGSKQT